MKVLLLVFRPFILLGGKIKGFKLFSGVLTLCLRYFGVGGLGSGSEQPFNQWEMTCPLPFNSTSPLSSKSNVPNLSNIHFVASEICIRSAIYCTYKNIQKFLKLEFIRTCARDSIYFYNYIFFHKVDIIFFLNFF